MTPSSLELFRKIIRFGIVTRSISRIIFEHLANRPWLCPLSYENPTCMFGHFCIWEIPLCQVMNITVSGTCKLVLLLESDDQRLRKQHIKMFPCVNMHQCQCHQWKKKLARCTGIDWQWAVQRNGIELEMWTFAQKTFRKTFFFLETPTLFELEVIKLNM